MSDIPKKIVAIDSMILVWAVKKKGPQEDLDRARHLFELFEEHDTTIILPTIVVAEYLTDIDEANHFNEVAAINKSFKIFPFDVRCAALAARLYRLGASGRKKGAADSRKCLRADSMIVATAKTHGAAAFYSKDSDCLSLAVKAGMEEGKLPTHSEHLFGPHVTKAAPTVSPPPS